MCSCSTLINGWKLYSHVFCCRMSVNYFLSVSLVENYGIDGMDGICQGMLFSHVAEVLLQSARICFMVCLILFQLVHEFVNGAFVSVSYSEEIGFEYHVTV